MVSEKILLTMALFHRPFYKVPLKEKLLRFGFYYPLDELKGMQCGY
jgi:hypothetical protein